MKAPAIRTKKAKPTVEAKPAKKVVMNKMLALNPRLSEKAYGLSELRNTYIFDVDAGANKFDISRAVMAQYEVGVVGVRIAGVPGKSKLTYRQRGRRSIKGQRSDIRKAYVTLKEGDKLPLFAATEEASVPKETK